MKDITIILPIVKSDDATMQSLNGALSSVYDNCKTYHGGKIAVLTVGPEAIKEKVLETMSGWKKFLGDDGKYGDSDFTFLVNGGNTDFCSQVNFAAGNVRTEWFSILEHDDEFAQNWFGMAHDYFYGNENASVFLPINQVFDSTINEWQFGNESVWASSFSDELGYFDKDCLHTPLPYFLSGGIFNTDDFLKAGGLKASLGVAFTYEFLLRMTNKKLDVYVVPKEGYKHVIGRDGSISKHWLDTLSDGDIQKYYALAKREYTFKEDRGTSILEIKPEDLK